MASRATVGGWKKAEVSLIASLLAETNLVLHVKLVHLELAAAFQAVALKAFTAELDHPFRRLLDRSSTEASR